MKNFASRIATILLFAAINLASLPASSEEPNAEMEVDDGWRIGAGARIGGYGFREVKDESVSWEDCRMNGTGLFMTLDFTRHFFAEAGLDLYHATGPTVAAGMDRISFHNQYALGFRIVPDWFVSPYVQLGGGPEVTHIAIGGAETTKVSGSGFMSLGGELNIGDFKLGMHFRALMMEHPEHGHGTTELALDGDGHTHGSTVASSSNAVETSWEVAGQAQFFTRYVF